MDLLDGEQIAQTMKRILIVKMSALGDVIHCLPIAAAIKNAYPRAFIGWLVSRPYHRIIEKLPYVDYVYIFERRRWGGIGNFWRHRHEFRQLMFEIRRARFDVVLDLQGLLRSGFFTLISGAPRRIGFANARECAPLTYNEKVKLPRMHAVDRYIKLAQQLDRVRFDSIFPVPLFPFPSICKYFADEQRPVLVLVPGSRWLTKRWPAQHFAELANIVVKKYDASVALVGASGDSKIGYSIMAQVQRPNNVMNLIGQTSLEELFAVMKRASVVISNDSGPMHMAVAVGTPTIALFGPTDPVLTGPYGKRHIVIQTNIECAVCLKRNCKNASFCMNSIAPEQVITCVDKIIDKKK